MDYHRLTVHLKNNNMRKKMNIVNFDLIAYFYAFFYVNMMNRFII